MKTITKNGSYLRVSDEVAEHEVKMNRAKYSSKSEWKMDVRDVKSNVITEADDKGKVTKSKKAEKAAKLKAKQKQ